MPSRPSAPASFISPRSTVPCSNQSAMSGRTRSSTNSRTAAAMSSSSSENRWSTFSRSSGRMVAIGLGVPLRQGDRSLLDLVLTQQDVVRGSAEGYEAVLTRDSGHRTREPVLDQGSDQAFADSAAVPGLVDDQSPAGGCGDGQQVVHRQRSEPAQVEHVGPDSLPG